MKFKEQIKIAGCEQGLSELERIAKSVEKEGISFDKVELCEEGQEGCSLYFFVDSKERRRELFCKLSEELNFSYKWMHFKNEALY